MSHLPSLPLTSQAYSVSDVARYLKENFESDPVLQEIIICGEISNLSRPTSGHIYFSLKDAGAVLPCAWFRQYVAPVSKRLREGQMICARGRISFYEQQGRVQLYVQQVEEMGEGDLYQRFLAVKQRLEDEGIFDSDRKRPIPPNPAVIGIVTSKTAAALQDMIRTFRLRWPLARLIIAPTLVQGADAPPQIEAAIRRLNAHGEAEVIIVARGGGSMEDLWAFNDVQVAYAIANSRIPIISGIGHEPDFTIADYAADLRAATPTAAATIVTPDIAELRAAISAVRQRMGATALRIVQDRRGDVQRSNHRLQREHPREVIERSRQKVEDARVDLVDSVQHRIDIERERLSGIALHLQALSPLLTIARGYATITRQHDGQAVRSTADISVGARVHLRLADGRAHAEITGIETEESRNQRA